MCTDNYIIQYKKPYVNIKLSNIDILFLVYDNYMSKIFKGLNFSVAYITYI